MMRSCMPITNTKNAGTKNTASTVPLQRLAAAQSAAANAGRVRFSGSPSVQATSSSMRMPP